MRELRGTAITPAEIDTAALQVGRDIRRAAVLSDSSLALRACKDARALQDTSIEVVLAVRLPWRDAAGREDEPAGIRMRSPCTKCGQRSGVARLTNGQHVVRCAACAAYAYCAPSAEVATW